MSQYPVGNDIVLAVTIVDEVSGGVIDPQTVAFQVLRPGGSLIIPTVTRSSSGNYTCEVTADTPGLWKWRAYGTNPNVAREETFEVLDSPF